MTLRFIINTLRNCQKYSPRRWYNWGNRRWDIASCIWPSLRRCRIGFMSFIIIGITTLKWRNWSLCRRSWRLRMRTLIGSLNKSKGLIRSYSSLSRRVSTPRNTNITKPCNASPNLGRTKALPTSSRWTARCFQELARGTSGS